MNVLLAAVSGAVLAIAVPNELFPMGHGLFGFIAIAPYFLALMRVRRARWASLVGVVFAVSSTIGSNYWLAYFREFSVWTLGGTTLGYMGYHALLGPFLWRILHSRPHVRPLLLAIGWAGYEYLKSIGFFGYPWGLIAFPYNNIPILLQHVEITGIWASSFMAAFANGIIAEILHSRDGAQWPVELLRFPRERRLIPATLAQLGRLGVLFGILATIIVGFGAYRLADPPKVTDTFSMTLIQQNVDSWTSGNEWRSIRRAQELTRNALAQRDHPPELIAWSETILRRPLRPNRDTFERRPEGDPFIPFVQSLPAPLLTGAPSIQSYDPFEPVNSAILLDTNARQHGFYGKRHLVPMAENVPFWNVPLMRSFFENVIGVIGVWTSGKQWSVFDMPRQGTDAPEDAWRSAGIHTTARTGRNDGTDYIRFGTPICYEDSFGYLCREFALLDADLLINLTNNSWSQTVSAQIQHFVAARYRAVENRMSLVRSTNSGYTAVVDAAGRVVADIPMFEEAYLNVEVPLYGEQGLTFYARFGDYLARFWIIVSVGVLIALFVRDRRRL